MMWGVGYDKDKKATSDSIPHPVFVGKDILSVTASRSKIFALSRKGVIYIIPVEGAKQRVGDERRKAKAVWYKLPYLRGTSDVGTDYEPLKTDVLLKKGEKWVVVIMEEEWS